MSDAWERVQLASARVPFRLKVGAVWVVLFAVLAFLGNAARPQATGEPADAYADVLAAYRRHITSTFSGAQSSRAVAEVVTRAVTDETPGYPRSVQARELVLVKTSGK